MIYFSEVKNKKIYTQDGIFLGKLRDFIFRYTEIPRITKIVVKAKDVKKTICIPMEYVIRLEQDIIIRKQFESVTIAENELYIDRNLLDKQIIDIGGSKVVRANDILIQKKDKNFTVVGVDIGLIGVMRWFGLAQLAEKMMDIIFRKKTKRSILSWSNIQPLEMAQEKLVLNVEHEKLNKMHPEDLADYLESTNINNVTKIVNSLDKEFASEVIAELNLNYQIALLKKLSLDKNVKIISLMDPDEAVDVLAEFPNRRRKLILEKMDENTRGHIEVLLQYGETSVGQYITSDFLTVPSHMTANKVINYIKAYGRDIENLNYIYVTNDKNQLTGVFNLQELLFQKQDTQVYKFMTQNLIVVHLKSSLQIVLRKLIKYKLSELPVVNDQKKMLGIVTVDDIGEVFLDKI